jgi:hypothetical protein
MTMSVDAANQILATFVRLKIFFASPLIIIPPPRKPIPTTTYTTILHVELGSTLAKRYVNIMKPTITSMYVLIPADFPLISLFAPIKNPPIMVITKPIAIVISSCLKNTSKNSSGRVVSALN